MKAHDESDLRWAAREADRMMHELTTAEGLYHAEPSEKNVMVLYKAQVRATVAVRVLMEIVWGMAKRVNMSTDETKKEGGEK